MEGRKKRALLARIEGQLSAMETCSAAVLQRHRQRVERALKALDGLPMNSIESDYFRRLRERIDGLNAVAGGHIAHRLLPHECTLARVDCILLQMRIRRFPRTKSAMAQFPA